MSIITGDITSLRDKLVKWLVPGQLGLRVRPLFPRLQLAVAMGTPRETSMAPSLPQNVSMWPLSPMKQNPVAALTPRQIGNAEYC